MRAREVPSSTAAAPEEDDKNRPLKPRRTVPCFAISAALVVLVVLRLLALPLEGEAPGAAPDPEPLPPRQTYAARSNQPVDTPEEKNEQQPAATVPPRFQAAAAMSPPPPAAVSQITIQFVEGTKLPLRITLRPDLSPSSAEYMREAARLACPGELYRSEGFLMQGRISCPAVKTPVSKGGCPAGVEPDKRRKCPSHDPQCGCHGPVMTPGMVGWAGGGTGPDFFVYTGEGPASHWSNDHTIIGEVDAEGLRALAELHALPAANQGGMTMLRKKVPLRVHAAAA